jgi:hypothetical protein
MIDREKAESQIRDVLATERSAAALSEKLFGPTGLFGIVAPDEAARREIVRSDLFRQAQARFRELQQVEAAAFARAVDEAEANFPSTGHRLKLEHLELG